MLLFLTIALIIVFVYIVERKKYEKTEYFQQTHNSFWNVRGNKGLLGEYYTYECLSRLSGYKRFVFNCYLPKQNEENTEVDVILIHESGVYVLESKNYSGWIFGTETNQYWTQTLPAGRGRSKKFQFLNPILQNKVHIKWLKAYLQEDGIRFLSYIVFSDRCTLKNINLTSYEHRVVNRYNILPDITFMAQTIGNQLSPEKIDVMYYKLLPLTNLDNLEKSFHVENIQRKYHSELDVSFGKTCPRCGSKLVIRTATKGYHAGEKFWGCSNYPKCRYIQNIDR